MVYTMSQREIDMRKMAQVKAARLNSVPRETVVLPAPIAKTKKSAKKKKAAKNSRKRG